MLNIRKHSWLGLSLSLAAILGVTACSSNEDSSAQQSQVDKVAVSENDASTATEIQEDNTVAEVEVSQTQVLDHDDVFLGRKVYLRGEMNDYGVQEAYLLKEVSTDTYCTLAPLRADWSPYRFKFADKNWTAGTNFGFAIPPAVMREGSARVQLNPNSRFEELRYEPAQDGIYRFCIEFEDNVPYASVSFMEESHLTTMQDVLDHSLERLQAQNFQIKHDKILAKAQAESEEMEATDDADIMEVAAVSSNQAELD